MKYLGENVKVEISQDRKYMRFMTTDLPVQKVTEWMENTKQGLAGK